MRLLLINANTTQAITDRCSRRRGDIAGIEPVGSGSDEFELCGGLGDEADQAAW